MRTNKLYYPLILGLIIIFLSSLIINCNELGGGQDDDPMPSPAGYSEISSDDYSDTSEGPVSAVEESSGTDDSGTVDSGTESNGSQTVQGTGLTAGSWDDKAHFSEFINYFSTVSDNYSSYPFQAIADRILIYIIDENSDPVHGAKITITDAQDSSKVYYTLSEGSVTIFPDWDGIISFPLNCQVEYNGALVNESITSDESLKTISLENSRISPASLDLHFTIDVTGSMSDELEYIKDSIEYIVSSVSEANSNINIRLGLVVYRDNGDQFVTNYYNFTSSVNDFKSNLNKYQAEGGGDYPEAMCEALYDMVNNCDWSADENTIKLTFVIADAPPQLGRNYSYVTEAGKARDKQIKIYPIAASGVADTAEMVMRYLSFVTGGTYIFLTDDSGIGYSHSEPSIPCYNVENLDKLIIRMINSELQGRVVDPEEGDIIRSVPCQ